MGGMHQAPVLVDLEVIEQPFDRALLAPGKAIVDLFYLLGDMDMNRSQVTGATAIDDLAQ